MRKCRSRKLYKLLGAAAVGTSFFASAAVRAEEIILRCEIQNFRCSPSVFRIDMQKHSLVTWSCAGMAPNNMGSPVQISSEAIVVRYRNGEEMLSLNRFTGDAIMLRQWRGKCQKIQGRVID